MLVHFGDRRTDHKQVLGSAGEREPDYGVFAGARRRVARVVDAIDDGADISADDRVRDTANGTQIDLDSRNYAASSLLSGRHIDLDDD